MNVGAKYKEKMNPIDTNFGGRKMYSYMHRGRKIYCYLH